MKLYYVHDPMCSWCWAFRPVLLKLTSSLPGDIEFIRLLGGLAADNDSPMSEATQHYVVDNWRRIQQQLPDTDFNYDFWTECQPRRSTYPACRAVIAARQQGHQYDEEMTYAIQKAYYLQARNPSDNDTLITLASEIGLDVKQFHQDLLSTKINHELSEELTTARQLELNSFPSFLLTAGERKLIISPDYQHAEVLLEKFKQAF